MQPNIDKGYKGIGMEGRIALWYARNTARDMPHFAALADRLTAALPEGSRVLEIAPGPGYLAIEIARRGRYQLTGLDISRTFVDIATHNASAAQVSVDFQQGNASAMPFRENSFDVIVCRAAFKNFTQPIAAMNEMHRVLKPGGWALIIDLRRDASMEDIKAYIRQSDLGLANSIIYQATFRYLLLPRAYSGQQFEEMAASSAFADARVTASAIGVEVTLQKGSSEPPAHALVVGAGTPPIRDRA